MLQIILITLLGSFLLQEPEDEQIEKAIRSELELYPEAHLRDIYKNFFQDAYGPGHLIPDTARAGKFLNQSLKQPIKDTVKWQAIGPMNDYYRINLQLVKDGTLPRDVLLEAMVESAILARNPNIKTWKKEWQRALEIIQEMNIDLPNYKTDKSEIEKTLSEGNVVMHHSEHYKEKYQRHYRIVHKSVFNRWKGMYLK